MPMRPHIRGGEHRRPIELQQPAVTTSSEGVVTRTWSTWATPWAAVEMLLGRELDDARRLNPEVTGRMRIYYRDGVTTKMRAVDSGTNKTYDILAIIDLERRRQQLVLLVRENVGETAVEER